MKAWTSCLRGQQAASNPELLKCLARALCLSSASTSACERDFGNVTTTFRKQSASPFLKELHLRITSFLKMEPDQSSEIVRRAQDIWREGFQNERKSGSKRCGNFVSGIQLAKRRCATLQNFTKYSLSKPAFMSSKVISICNASVTVSLHLVCWNHPRLQIPARARVLGSSVGDWR